MSLSKDLSDSLARLQTRAGVKGDIVAFAASLMIVDLRDLDKLVGLGALQKLAHLYTYRVHCPHGGSRANLLKHGLIGAGEVGFKVWVRLGQRAGFALPQIQKRHQS